MYRSLLVPLDGSTLAERGLRAATAIASHTRAALHLVHVYRPMVIDELPVYGLTGDAARNAAEAFITAAADRVRASLDGVTVTGEVLEGSPAHAIVARAAELGAGLIVMSSHGRTGASRFWLGSVTDAVMRSATVPVLMVRAESDTSSESGLFDRILVPLDGSALAETVLPHVKAMATLASAHVHMLQVEEKAEDVRVSVWAIAKPVPDDITDRLARADRYLHHLAEQSPSEWSPATLSVEARGAHRVGEAIAAVATERDIDLIAMATHGRGASRMLLGSVADKVIRGTACSVLLVRARPPAAS